VNSVGDLDSTAVARADVTREASVGVDPAANLDAVLRYREVAVGEVGRRGRREMLRR